MSLYWKCQLYLLAGTTLPNHSVPFLHPGGSKPWNGEVAQDLLPHIPGLWKHLACLSPLCYLAVAASKAMLLPLSFSFRESMPEGSLGLVGIERAAGNFCRNLE